MNCKWQEIPRVILTLLAGILAGSIFVSAAFAQSTAPQAAPQAKPAKPAKPAVPANYQPNALPRRAMMYYAGAWGIQLLGVKAVESGELIRFTYSVLDPVKAKPLNNKETEPYLIDLQAGVRLGVPALEKVGKLRTVNEYEAGKNYWMAFSNPGRKVRPGDHVIIVIGNFRADGLIVQ